MTPTVTSNFVRFSRIISNLPAIDYTEPAALQQRIDQYLDLCERFGIKPGVTMLCNAIGIDKKTLFRWSKGEYRAGTHQEIAVRYYNLLEGFWEMSMQEGKLNPVTGIFLAKNHFGYSDKQELEVSRPDLEYDNLISQEELEEKYNSIV